MDDRQSRQSLTAGQEHQPSSAPHQPACFTLSELIAMTKLSESTLRRRVKDGSIPCIQPGGPRTRMLFSPDILDRLAAASSSQIEPVAASPVLQPKPKLSGPVPNWRRMDASPG